MVVFSIMFLIISYLLTNIFGPVGFILANCINMAARIAHSLYFINNKYSETQYRPLEGLTPTLKFVLVLITSGICTKYSEVNKCFNIHSIINYFFKVYLLPQSLLLHISFGAVFFLFTLGVWALDNKALLRLGYEKYKRKVSLKSD